MFLLCLVLCVGVSLSACRPSRIGMRADLVLTLEVDAPRDTSAAQMVCECWPEFGL
jgi:hypothetical protein